MMRRPLNKRLAFLLFNGALLLGERAALARSAPEIPDPCSGRSGLLAMLDRPTVSDSACVVPQGRVATEAGYVHAALNGGGSSDNLPEMELRFGLPERNELVLIPPNYSRQYGAGSTLSGWSATTVGLKHELGYTRHWLGAVEGLITPSSGSAAYGAARTGAAVNGIIAYAPGDTTGISLQVGVSSQVNPSLAGGGRFTSFNPLLTFTWDPRWNWQYYLEVYGQSNVGPGQGSGYNADGGLQYLVTSSFEVDVEEGVRLHGQLGGFTHYTGVGMGLLF
ncbi:MAG: transporter family protein [Acidiferrobacterales bacterium]